MVLASTSRYRRELLGRLGLRFEVRAPTTDESALAGEPPERMAERLAAAKASSIAAHDAICGGLARMYHLASANAELARVQAVFLRFEAGYASHADAEAELLHELTARLDAGQRARLADLVRGL